MILTTKQVLFNFSISREVLRRWTEKGLRRVDRGQFDLKEIIRFRDEFIVGFGNDEMAKAKLLREQSKAKYQQLLTTEKEGSLISKNLVDGFIKNIILEAKQILLQIPYRLMESLAVENDPKAVFLILKEEVYRALEILSQGRKKFKMNFIKK